MVMIIKAKADVSQVRQMLKDIRSRGRNLQPVLRKTGKSVLEPSIEQQFRRSGTPKWQRLKKSRRRPLIKSGKLSRSYQTVIVTRHHVVVESREVYGVAHQLGLSRRGGRVPAHSRRITSAFGRAIIPQTVQVRAHSKMLPPIPARPVGIVDKDMERVLVLISDHILAVN